MSVLSTKFEGILVGKILQLNLTYNDLRAKILKLLMVTVIYSNMKMLVKCRFKDLRIPIV